MDKIILGNRYELKEKIAEGGMSTIYKAYCHILNRVVCVKILKSEFSEDEEFLIKFNNEAKAAASLNHPNIINVYDVGKDEDIAYIVMEYVDGRNLKEIIREEGVLEEHHALSIIRQICLALSEAHSKGIIHRDIKPHNIMVNKNGIVKVGDFGIARAVSSTTITTAGNVMGSVYYFSPEQARGGFVDERTDIYSLGIVLYELLIGRPPYDADTPISVALKHLHEEVTIPEDCKENISIPVQNLILKMTQKNIAKRHKNVIQVIDDIDKILGNKDLGTIYSPIIDNDMEQTRVIPALKNQVNEYEDYDDIDNYQEEIVSVKDEIKTRKKHKIESEDNITKNKKIRRSIILILALILIFLVFFTLIKFGVFSFFGGEKIEVPNLINMPVEEAELLLKENGLELKIVDNEINDEIDEGRIIRQYPSEKSMIRKGNEITVVVSTREDEVIEIKDYTGMKIEEVEEQFKDGPISLLIEGEYNDEIEEGLIISQVPEENTKLKKGDSLKLYVSKGKEKSLIKVPDFVGKKLEYAQQNIDTLGFKIGSIETREDDLVEENTILEQNPVGNTEVEKETAINFVVSKKTPLVTKSVEIVLPQKENINVTVIEKSSGETILNQNLSTINGNENLSVELSGKSGETKQLDIYLDGEFYASTAPIAF